MRTRNGWVDTGKRIGKPNQKCYNCGSDKYYQTVSKEHCPSCGMVVDYWGDGTNKVFNKYQKRQAYEESQRRQREQDEIMKEHRRFNGDYGDY